MKKYYYLTFIILIIIVINIKVRLKITNVVTDEVSKFIDFGDLISFDTIRSILDSIWYFTDFTDKSRLSTFLIYYFWYAQLDGKYTAFGASCIRD